jgi:hypothetical protein
MEYRDEKRRLHQLAVEQGLDSRHNFTACTGAPAVFVKRWMKQFFEPPAPMNFPVVPKLVNHFALGADPEFAFFDKQGRYIHAETVGMTTILPFGCDMAGRQAELRAHSSRFALEVVASMVDALRWIPELAPEAGQLDWRAMPFVANDGCGGHVHFGRKRPERNEEIAILGKAFQLLIAAGTFDKNTCAKRQEYTKYGRPGDFRLQSHGYEYRAFPTWMYSPWGAYFVMVVSKLLLQYKKPLLPVKGREIHQLVNLLRYFQGEDDDAAIALRTWYKRGFPVAHEQDFKQYWGVSGPPVFMPLKRLYFPLSLKPEERTCEELFESFTTGLPLVRRSPKPTWEPFQLGKDFYSVLVQPHVFEIPNIAQGLVSKHRRVLVQFSNLDESVQFLGATGALNQDEIKRAVQALDCRVHFAEEPGSSLLSVCVPKEITKDREKVRLFRAMLCDTNLFPICKGEDIETVNWSIWDTPVEFVPKKIYGKILASVKGQKEPPAPKPKQELYNYHLREEF